MFQAGWKINQIHLIVSGKNFLEIAIEEHSGTLWHSSLSLDLQTLDERREQLSLTFAKRALKNPKFMHFSPLNQKSHQINTRNVE